MPFSSKFWIHCSLDLLFTWFDYVIIPNCNSIVFQKWFKGSKICNVVRQHGFYPNNKYTGWIVKKKTRKRNSQYIFWFSYFGTYPTTINTQSILNTVIIKYEWKQVNLTKVYRKESCRKMCTNNNFSCIKTFID